MSTQFAFDLRLARRKAGYTQADVAIMLDNHQSVVSAIERGTICPDLDQIITLSLLYGRSFEAFFAEVMSDCRARLQQRLPQMPLEVRDGAHTFNRAGSLRRLKERLANTKDHGSA